LNKPKDIIEKKAKGKNGKPKKVTFADLVLNEN
jgi:hypothetical protein